MDIPWLGASARRTFLGIMVLYMVVAVISVKYSLKEPRVNTLLLDNVEALAAYEQDMPHTCLGSGSVDCPISKVKVKYVFSGYSLEE